MLKIGSRVKVMLPLGERMGAETLSQYHGKVTVIKEIHTYHKGTSSLGRTFVLAGCKSDWGIDYEFLEDWLIPLDGVMDE